MPDTVQCDPFNAFVNLDHNMCEMSLESPYMADNKGAPLFLCQSCNLYVKIQLSTQTFN